VHLVVEDFRFRLRAPLKSSTFFTSVPVETFFFFKTQKSATNSSEIIYNFEFHRQP
jgi:hypothetical protein